MILLVDGVDGGKSVVSDVLWNVFLVGGRVFDDLLGGVSDDVLYRAEGVPVEEGVSRMNWSARSLREGWKSG